MDISGVHVISTVLDHIHITYVEFVDIVDTIIIVVVSQQICTTSANIFTLHVHYVTGFDKTRLPHTFFNQL